MATFFPNRTRRARNLRALRNEQPRPLGLSVVEDTRERDPYDPETPLDTFPFDIHYVDPDPTSHTLDVLISPAYTAQQLETEFTTPQIISEMLRVMRREIRERRFHRVRLTTPVRLEIIIGVTNGERGFGGLDFTAVLPLREFLQIHTADIMNVLDQFGAQSNREFNDTELEFLFQFMRGEARGGAFNGTIPDYIGHYKDAMETFDNQPDRTECGHRILAVLNYHGRMDTIVAKTVKSKRLLKTQIGVIKAALPEDHVGMLSISDFQYLVNKLPRLKKVRICIFGLAMQLIQEIRGEEWEEGGSTHYIMFDSHAEHYYWMRWKSKIPGNRMQKFCGRCLKFVRRDRAHQCCGYICKHCTMPFDTLDELEVHEHGPTPLTCTKCKHKKCYTEECLAYHERYCRYARRCDECHAILTPNHQCGEILCPACGEAYQEDSLMEPHQCFFIPEEPMPEADLSKHYAFDFESMFIEQDLPRGSRMIRVFKHVMNLVVIKRLDGEAEAVFNTMDQFLNYILQKEREGSVFWAHNLKGYDGRLIFSHILSTPHHFNGVVWRGLKLMSFKIGKVTFKDSLCHFQGLPLAKLPKTFGLTLKQRTEIATLDEPTQELMAKDFFPYRFNSPQHQHYIGEVPPLHWFDVDMMPTKKRAECMEWHEKMCEKYNPTRSYDFMWHLVEYCHMDVDILAAALKFWAEHWHERTGVDPLTKLTLPSVCMTNFLTNHTKPNTIPHLSYEYYMHLKEGNCMQGGRTDVRQMIGELTQEEMDRGCFFAYFDVCSLYPYVQIAYPYAIGPPTTTFYTEDLASQEQAINVIRAEGVDYVGSCDVAYRMIKKMYHPYITHYDHKLGKLLASCLPGRKVMTTLEARIMLECGYYEITRVYRIDTFEASHDLFKSYIFDAVKGKMEASGMPPHITTDEQWLEFRQQVFDKYGFYLEKENMVKNDGKRAICKLQANCQWGKLAQSIHHPKSTLIRRWEGHKLEQLFQKEADTNRTTFKVNSMYRNDNNELLVQHSDLDDHTGLKHTNLLLGCQVTAAGRTELWKMMVELGDRVLYHDTDSIIFKYDPTKFNIPKGADFLGEWTDECAGQKIVKFVGLGPKSYAYRLEGGEEVIHMKGITLHHAARQKITLDSLADLVKDSRKTLTVDQLKFEWRLKKGACEGMISYIDEKTITSCYNKGKVDENFRVLPFGYDDLPDDDSLRSPETGRFFSENYFAPKGNFDPWEMVFSP